jgi:zinc transporter ZupT
MRALLFLHSGMEGQATNYTTLGDTTCDTAGVIGIYTAFGLAVHELQSSLCGC